jgi:hypothetical protein
VSEATITGYCRACGRALTENEVHRAHGAFYCKEHAPADGSAFSPGASPYAGPYANPYNGSVPPPAQAAGISPVAAFWLGLIPGVGAIYNGQYAKGFVHVAVVGLVISIISNDAAGGFEPLAGLMLAAFWAYMPFEAYHTARQRQLGQPVDELSSLVPVRGARFPAIPVILIGLGTVLLLDNLGLLELRRAIRFWPMLLIVAGMYMLYNRFALSHQGGPDSAEPHDPGPGNSRN